MNYCINEYNWYDWNKFRNTLSRGTNERYHHISSCEVDDQLPDMLTLIKIPRWCLRPRSCAWGHGLSEQSCDQDHSGQERSVLSTRSLHEYFPSLKSRHNPQGWVRMYNPEDPSEISVHDLQLDNNARAHDTRLPWVDPQLWHGLFLHLSHFPRTKGTWSFADGC